MRYTLRLLTLDQLGRAATLICALEELRRRHPKELGNARFTVGLWVGATATAKLNRKDFGVAYGPDSVVSDNVDLELEIEVDRKG